MAEVLNENMFEVIDDKEIAEDKVESKPVASKSRRKRSAEDDAKEKISKAHAQVYMTFTNLTDRYVPLGGFNIAPKGKIKLHRSIGQALTQSQMYKEYERLVWLKSD